MTFSLSNISGKPYIFEKIIDSDDFVKKIHSANSLYNENPIFSLKKTNLAHANSTESIDSAYGSDVDDIAYKKSLSCSEFKNKVNKLKNRLYECYSSVFLKEKDTDSLIKEGNAALKQFSEDNSEIKGYANFTYKLIPIPGADRKQDEVISNFLFPKKLTGKKGSKIPLKINCIEEIPSTPLPSSKLISYERCSKYAKDIVYIHYNGNTGFKNTKPPRFDNIKIKQSTASSSRKKHIEEKIKRENKKETQQSALYRNIENRNKVANIPSSNYNFNGNIPQTKTSYLRGMRIKERYSFSSQADHSKYRLLNEKPDLIKIKNSINKEKILTEEMNRYIRSIDKIQHQMDINDKLLKKLR